VAAATYCLRGDLSDEMQVTDPGEDARLDRAIIDASRVIDAFCFQEAGIFAPRTQTKIFDIQASGLSGRGLSLTRWVDPSSIWPGWLNVRSISIPPCISVSQLATDVDGDGVYETIWTPQTDYLLLPYNRETKRTIEVNQQTGNQEFPIGQGRVQVTGSWGIVEDGITPYPIRRACLQLAMIYYRKPTPGGGGTGGLGGAAIHIGYQDIDVAAILWEVAGKYRERVWGA
jgi:hypothetical protein